MSKITNPEALARITEISESDRQAFEARMARAFEAIEFPESDPAEADPAEAWPSVRIEIDGRTIVGQLSYLGVVIGTVETIDGPAMVTRDELYRWNAGMPAFLTCPMHGTDCEAWA